MAFLNRYQCINMSEIFLLHFNISIGHTGVDRITEVCWAQYEEYIQQTDVGKIFQAPGRSIPQYLTPCGNHDGPLAVEFNSGKGILNPSQHTLRQAFEVRSGRFLIGVFNYCLLGGYINCFWACSFKLSTLDNTIRLPIRKLQIYFAISGLTTTPCVCWCESGWIQRSSLQQKLRPCSIERQSYISPNRATS